MLELTFRQGVAPHVEAPAMWKGSPAIGQRAFELEERVAVSGAGMYEARCRSCFVPHADAPTVHEG